MNNTQQHYQAVSNMVILPANSEQSKTLKRTIAIAYRKYFKANISHYLPYLAQVYNEQKKTIATFGLNPATLHADLFLEQYLPNSIESIISQHSGESVSRQQILEIGQLAVCNLESTKRLFKAITQHCLDNQYRYMVFTMTSPLKALIDAFGIHSHFLANANKESINNLASWGSYYDNNPVVLYVDTAQAAIDLDLTSNRTSHLSYYTDYLNQDINQEYHHATSHRHSEICKQPTTAICHYFR